MQREPAEDDAPDLDLRTIRIVDAIHRAGSLTGASALLGLSQPAISQHVQRAERRTALSLVERHGRSVRLTDAGRVVAESAGGILQAVDATRRRVHDVRGAGARRVVLAGFPSASATLLPGVVAVLRRTHPGFQLGYTEAEPADAIGLIGAGTADLAIIATYPGDERTAPPGMTVLPLFLDEMLLVLPADHPLAGQRTVDPADLEDDDWIAGCPSCRG